MWSAVCKFYYLTLYCRRYNSMPLIRRPAMTDTHIIIIIIMGLTVDIHIVALIVHCIWIELEFGKCWFWRRGKNRSTRRKTSRSREENQQQTQPTYDAETGNRTRATLVGGECSHHCATPAPLYIYGSW